MMPLTRRHLLQLIAGSAALAADPAKVNMIVRSARPEDFEMPLDGFEDWITPVERFFVRSHHYTPKVDVAQWRLKVGGLIQSPLTLSLADIKQLPKTEVVSVLECAGNGRALYDPPMPGVQWVYGAVGNGRWAGVRLADVLAKAGLKDGAVEVLFDGSDVPVGTMPEFKRSVPLRKCLDRDTLLAYEMNGREIPVSHGYPLRLIVPGWAGDSWMKWVTAIEVLDREYDGFFMKTAYRHPGKPVVPGTAVPPERMHPVQSLRVKSVITSPAEESTIKPGVVRIRGAAWSGETPVESVEVSVDRGRSWRKAQLGRDRSTYGWRLWEFEWPARETGHFVIMARATDSKGETQPMVQEWNPSGYQNNTVHQVAIAVSEEVARPEPATASSAPVRSSFQAPASFAPTCLPCHGEDIVMQQRLSRTQWEREIDKMVRWGTRLKPADREPILDYLMKLYGPRPRK